MVGFPHPFAGSALGLNPRAEPTGAVFTFGSPDFATVTFSENLVNGGGLDVGNWFVRKAGNKMNVTSVIASDTAVTLNLTTGGANPGSDVVTFTPPPDDIVTRLSLLPVLEFADFPMT